MEDRKGLILCDVSSLCCSLHTRMKMTFNFSLAYAKIMPQFDTSLSFLYMVSCLSEYVAMFTE